MTEISRSRRIAAGLESVWGALADFGAIADWAANVDHSSMLEGADQPAAIGASRRVQVGRNTLVERIVQSDAPRVLAYDISGLPPRIRHVQNRWTLQAEGDERTLVTLTTDVDLGPRPPQQLAAKVVGRVLARQSDTMLTGLADHLEHHRD